MRQALHKQNNAIVYYETSSVPADRDPVSAIAAEEYHTCPIKAQGQQVACWGNDAFGQRSVSAGHDPVSAIAAGPPTTHLHPPRAENFKLIP